MPQLGELELDPGKPLLICDADELRNEIDFNTRPDYDGEVTRVLLDIDLALTDWLTLGYLFGYIESEVTRSNDADGHSRMGGGICPGETEPSPFCAADGRGGGFRWLLDFGDCR